MTQTQTQDLHVESLRPLIPPAILCEEGPLREPAAGQIARHRDEIARVLSSKDKRLVVRG